MAVTDTETVRQDALVRELDGRALIYAKEVAMQGHPQWTDSWTTNNTWTDVEGSFTQIDFNDWPNHSWFFEMIGKTDAGTGHYQLYNITDSAAVAGSEITTTSTTAERIRSSAITKLTGIKEFKIQHKIVGGNGTTEFVNSMMSRPNLMRADI